MAQDQQFIARDFMGLGKTADAKERGESKNSCMPLKVQEVDLGHFSGSAASINNGIFFNGMAFAGSKHPFRSNVATFQNLLSGNLLEEKLIEQSAESAPERSYSTLPHPMQVWWRGDPSMKHSSTTVDDFGPKTQGAGGFGGSLPKNALCSPTPSSHTHALPEAVQRMPASELTEKKDSAPLTIFYGGHVNVFNDITAEKAQAIMFLASTGNLQGMCSSAGTTNASPVNLAMTSASMPTASAVNKGIPPPTMRNVGTINLPSRIQMDQQNVYNIESGQVAPNQAGFGSGSMQLDLGHSGVPVPPSQEQPAVPTALPQARKASLARFLERRRERVQTKSPYPSKQADSSQPEERFSSSNDFAPYRPHGHSDERKKISLPSWMERLPEYSSDMVVKEDTKIVSV